MSIQVNVNKATSELARTIRKQLVPMLVGSPGEGKSAIGHAIANMYNLKVIDVRLSQADPADLLGYPRIDEKTGKASYAPMDTFPLEGDPIPEGFSGWLLFFDEFNSAPRSVQAASYKVVLDKMVGQRKLHPNVAIMCAGNLETDNAIVEPMSTALQSRLVHFELAQDSDAWLEWAGSNGIDHRITSFIRYKPGNLYAFDPNHSDKTYGCPRTWSFASRFTVGEEINNDLLPCLAGTISEGLAREFIGFCGIYKDLPTMADIIKDPSGLKMPDEPSVLFALSGAIAHNATEGNIEKLVTFIRRMPVEFQVITLRETIRRNKTLVQSPAIQTWIVKDGIELYS